jgi:hypothetical protein
LARPETAQFSIGRVLGDSFGVYARNFIGFTALALLIGLIELLFTIYSGANQVDEFGEVKFVGYQAMVMGFITLLTRSLTEATLIYGTFQDLRGQKAGVGACVGQGLTSIISVIFGSIISSIGIGAASLLFLIPGLIVMTIWWVYVPAIVVERKGVFDAFSRIAYLTAGHRWGVLGLIIVVILLSIGVTYISEMISYAVITMWPGVGTFYLFLVVDYVGGALITAFGAVLVAVGYYYLRAEREGIDADQIASIFD